MHSKEIPRRQASTQSRGAPATQSRFRGYHPRQPTKKTFSDFLPYCMSHAGENGEIHHVDISNYLHFLWSKEQGKLLL